MAQFVVIWCILLYVSSSTTTLSEAKVAATEHGTTIVPLAIDNGVVNEVDENGQHLVSVDKDVDVDVDVDVGEDVYNNVVGGGEVTATEVDSGVQQQQRVYHPVAVGKPRVIDEYDHRSLDGQYEYRYLLDNGEARYERAYWQPVGKNMVLARKGYYSYRMKNQKFLTVFYTADQNGYREDSSTYSRAQPNLPRSMEIPEYVTPSTNPPITQRPTNSHVYTSTTTRRPYVHATGNPFIQFYPSTGLPQTAPPQSSHHSHHQHQTQIQSSSVASNVQNSAGVHPSAVGGHSSSGIHSSSGVPLSWGVHHTAGAYPSTTYPSVPHQSWQSSGVHSLSGVQSPSQVHSSSGVQSSTGSQMQSGAHISHYSSFGAHSPSHAHQSSAVQITPSHQRHSIDNVAAGQASPSSNTPTSVSPPAPVESYHYNF